MWAEGLDWHVRNDNKSKNRASPVDNTPVALFLSTALFLDKTLALAQPANQRAGNNGAQGGPERVQTAGLYATSRGKHADNACLAIAIVFATFAFKPRSRASPEGESR